MAVLESGDLEPLKQVQQQTWASGDFSLVANRIQFVAEQLAESARLRPGWRVLDVATGSGNAAIAAARSGTSVVGVDYVPELLASARTRAAAEGFDIEFLEGDAELLPVDSASFDAVLSVYGAMFAPDHTRAARELLRACRPGGTIALASWTPGSFVNEMFGLISRYAPPPAGLPSPMLWGDEDYLRDLFGAEVTEMRSVTRTRPIRHESPEAFVTFYARYYGPMHQTFAALDADRRADLAGDLADLARAADVNQDSGSIEIRAEYLETIACRA